MDFEVAVNLAREKVEGGPSEDIVSHLQQASNALRQLSMAIQKLSNVSQKKTTAGVRDDCSKGRIGQLFGDIPCDPLGISLC